MFHHDSIHLPIGHLPKSSDQETLHLKHFYPAQDSTDLPVVLLIHGAIENGRIFYSEDGKKGLAPFLAKQGYEVFVADLRGRGLSQPNISRHAQYGQTETITQEIPAFLDHIQQLHPQRKVILIGHSWGGVLLSSFLARFPSYLRVIDKMVFFGTKRIVTVINPYSLFYIRLMWNRVFYWIIKRYGYLPEPFGADRETRKSHHQSAHWVQGNPWRDLDDGFDYGDAIKGLQMPPTLFVAGVKDHYLGHPKDVRDFVQEFGAQQATYQLLGRKQGNLHNYGHIDMLTHPFCERDHFLDILNWLQKNN